jgi:hypothetical protein
MLVSQGATSTVALAVLIAINALANGSAIALARDAACKKREATARGAATRRGRASAPVAASMPHRPHPKAAVHWSPAMTDDTIDATVVSETRLLA